MWGREGGDCLHPVCVPKLQHIPSSTARNEELERVITVNAGGGFGRR